jgi:hypothetical protein
MTKTYSQPVLDPNELDLRLLRELRKDSRQSTSCIAPLWLTATHSVPESLRRRPLVVVPSLPLFLHTKTGDDDTGKSSSPPSLFSTLRWHCRRRMVFVDGWQGAVGVQTVLFAYQPRALPPRINSAGGRPLLSYHPPPRLKAATTTVSSSPSLHHHLNVRRCHRRCRLSSHNHHLNVRRRLSLLPQPPLWRRLE